MYLEYFSSDPEMNQRCTTSDREPDLTTGIRLDLPLKIDDHMDKWAEESRRSKREHVTFLVEEIAECHAKDPMILHWLGLLKVGAAKIVPAVAS